MFYYTVYNSDVTEEYIKQGAANNWYPYPVVTEIHRSSDHKTVLSAPCPGWANIFYFGQILMHEAKKRRKKRNNGI